jgi:aminoglycoside 6'-N-acetyltransferase I
MSQRAMKCKPVRRADFELWLAMGRRLWPRAKGLRPVFEKIFMSPRERVFICWIGGAAAGFVEVSMRRDYVEGSTTSPTGYIEGIFVERRFRRRGVARLLVRAAETWAKQRGAIEIGSDTRLANRRSQRFHRALRFKEVEKNVAFIKKIR